MRATVEKQVKAGTLPLEIRGSNFDPGDVVRVSVQVVRTVNGLTPEEEDEILQAAEEARRDRDSLPSFTNAHDLIAHLRAECEKTDD